MPNRDQSGPLGGGPRTGRGMGLCGGNAVANDPNTPEAAIASGRGNGWGRGCGNGRGQGRCNGWGRGSGNGPGQGRGNRWGLAK
jgi:hypothetical protein